MTEENTEQTQQTQENNDSGSAELTVQDLNSMKQIIDLATQRGAFRSSELSTVGQIHDKLESFLNEIASQQGQSQGDQ